MLRLLVIKKTPFILTNVTFGFKFINISLEILTLGFVSDVINSQLITSEAKFIFYSQFNDIPQTHDHKDPENVVRHKYYELEDIQSMRFPNKNS